MARAAGEVLELVRDGRARFCVAVQPPQTARSLQPAVEALMEHLTRCLGAAPPWFERRAAQQPPVRLVLQLDVLADLDAQAFEIDGRPGELVLRGRTPLAADYAVHHFLEQAFAVRWLWPGESGTITPPARDVAWPLGSSRHAPDFLWRQLWVGGAFYREDDLYLAERKLGRVSARTLDELFTWHRRQRLGGLQIVDGHRWAEICPPDRYGQTHPEYFALVQGRRDTTYHDGKHGNQPCTTNPDVVRITADYIKAQFRAQPQLDGYSLALNDGMGFCECASCVALDREAQAQAHREGAFDRLTQEHAATATAAPGLPDAAAAQRCLTDRMLGFANAVAEQVETEFPDKLLLTLIYSVYRQPPRRTVLHRNVIAQFCSFTPLHTEPAVREAEFAVFAQLKQFAQRLGVYDYLVNGTNGTLPRGVLPTLAQTLRQYHQSGARYYSSQAGLDFATAGLTYYFAARALWDVHSDPQQVTRDYCRAAFSAAADTIERYLHAFTQRWEAVWPTLNPEQRRMESLAPILYPLDWLAARQGELDEAHRLLAADPAAQQRVAFLRQGLRFLELLTDVCRTADWSQRSVQRDKLDDLLRWVDEHRDGCWISATWFDYQRLVRNGLLK